MKAPDKSKEEKMAAGKQEAGETLIAGLQNPALYDHPVEAFRVLETHISWVLLTGPYAYKIKKPVDFGFLDFSTLPRRRHYCEEEIRLNRRFAPDLYLGVIPLTGTPEHPMPGGQGEAIEYAVKMHQFPQEALLSSLAARHALQGQQVDEMAAEIASFHARSPAVDPAAPFGSPLAVHYWVQENFRHIRPLLEDAVDLAKLEDLAQWCEAERDRCQHRIQARKEAGFVRECHGDLHLGNMVLWGGRIVPFDCIEFNESLRWIDVLSEVAFVMMDLRDRGHPAFACRFLNAYLQHTGDYAGMGLLRYYLVYRALVRAKVAILRLAQAAERPQEQAAIRDEYQGYVNLALSFSRERQPLLIITHGLSGTGKSTLAGSLVEALGATQIRADRERKRLFGYAAEADTRSALGGGIYTPEAHRRTYERLAELAASALDFGYPVIVDATFLRQAQRQRFRELARRLEVPFVILACHAPEPLLRARLADRAQTRQDVSEAGPEVLALQTRAQEALSEAEMAHTLWIDTAEAAAPETVAEAVLARIILPSGDPKQGGA